MYVQALWHLGPDRPIGTREASFDASEWRKDDGDDPEMIGSTCRRLNPCLNNCAYVFMH